MANIKICTKCGIIKLDQYDFYIYYNKLADRYYYRDQCVKCACKYAKQYLQDNPDYKKQWRKDNLDKVKENTKQYNQDNKEHKNEYDKHRRFKRYGITLDDYNVLLEKQKHKCIICGRHQDEFKKGLVVDHDHTTGKIRGLLCTNCNTALGLVKDDINILYSMIEYLKYP